MPRYALFRDYDPSMTRTQIDGMVMAGGAALQMYVYRGDAQPHSEPHGISWVRSYWQPGGAWGVCVFEAPSLPVLAGFQDLCGTPYLDAMEVEEEEGPAHLSDTPNVALTQFRAADTPLTTLSAEAPEAARQLVRAYYCAERRQAFALFPKGTEASVAGIGPVAEVVELSPAEYQ